MEEVKPGWLKRFWKMLDGNKTIVCTTLLIIVDKVPIPEPYKGIAEAILIALGATALGHHAYKGYFTTKKGG